jgi:site-specific DNA recombinase
MAPKAKAPALIPAVSYLRKSTKGLHTDVNGRKRERQEKSISQQRTEIEKLAAREGYKIVREYADVGISGSKSGTARPDFTRMLDDATTKRDFVAIICDDVDRFSRQNWDDVQNVAYNLKNVGIKFIVTAAQGTYDLNENSTNLGQALKFVIDAWSSNQHNRKLGRRITLRNIARAEEGKRAAPIPYAMKSDGNGGLVHGDRKAVATVKRIFQMFVDELMPFNKIMAVLNDEKIPSPRGKSKWSAVTVRDILSNAVYAGDFTYGRRQRGKFSVVGADGEAMPAEGAKPWLERPPIFKRTNAYKPIVDRKTFDAAQRQAAKVRERFATGKRDRHNRYVLSDILVCDHCGSKMAGATPPSSGKRRYYCGSTRRFGKGACSAGTPAINEDDILPQVMSLFFETRDDLTELLTSPPDDLISPNIKRREENLHETELREVTSALQRTREKLLAMDWDAETAMMIQAQLNKLVARQKELEGLVKTNGLTREHPDFFYNNKDAERLDEFWREFDRTAISAAVPPAKINEFLASFQRDPFREDLHVLLNPIVVNEALRALGTEVRLHFKTTTVTTESGTSNRYSLKGGRYRLGQFKGKIAGVSSSKGIKGSATDSM